MKELHVDKVNCFSETKPVSQIGSVQHFSFVSLAIPFTSPEASPSKVELLLVVSLSSRQYNLTCQQVASACFRGTDTL